MYELLFLIQCMKMFGAPVLILKKEILNKSRLVVSFSFFLFFFFLKLFNKLTKDEQKCCTFRSVNAYLIFLFFRKKKKKKKKKKGVSTNQE